MLLKDSPDPNPIPLAPFTDEDTEPGVLETSVNDGNFLLSFDGPQHRTELTPEQIQDLSKQTGESVQDLEGMCYNPQFQLNHSSAQVLYDRLGEYLKPKQEQAYPVGECVTQDPRIGSVEVAYVASSEVNTNHG